MSNQKGEVELAKEDLIKAVNQVLARMDLNYSKTLGAKFQEYENLDGDHKAPVAVAYSVFEGPKAVDVMLEKYRTSKFDEDRLKILQALLSSRYPHTVVNVLSMVFTGEMKRQDRDLVHSVRDELTAPPVPPHYAQDLVHCLDQILLSQLDLSLSAPFQQEDVEN